MKIAEILCYCGIMQDLEQDDLGFDEFECCRCGTTLSIPEDITALAALNAEMRKCISTVQYNGKIRIMAIQETGEAMCVKAGLNLEEDILGYVIAGIKADHPEWRVFTEPEENLSYAVEQTLLDERA